MQSTCSECPTVFEHAANRVTCSYECHRARKRRQAAEYRERNRERVREQLRRQAAQRRAERKQTWLQRLAQHSPLAALNAAVRRQQA